MPVRDVLPHQHEALRLATSGTPDELVTIMMVSGYGAGKTETIVDMALLLGEANAPAPTMVVEPTIPMLRDVLVPKFRAMFERYGIEESRGYTERSRTPPCYRYVRNTSTFEVYLDDDVSFQILLRSGHEPERIVGVEVGAMLLDEAGLLDKEVFERAKPRVRHPAAKHRVFAAVGTPEGRASAFYRFAEGDPAPGTHLIRASTWDNPFLPGGPGAYIKDTMGHLDERVLKQYVDGYFIARQGQVYDELKAEWHNAPTNPRMLLAGELVNFVDFGTTTAYAGFGVIKKHMGNEVVHVFDEVISRREGTHRLAEKMRAKWGKIAEEFGGAYETADTLLERVEAYTDSSPWQRSDRAVIERELGVPVIKMRRNPRIMDRVYSVNTLLRENRVTVDAHRCKELWRTLSQQGYDKEIPEKPRDDGEGMIGIDHAGDAFGMLCVQRWPVLAPTGNNTEASYH